VIHILIKEGVQRQVLNPDNPMITIPGNTWFAAQLQTPSPEHYALCGCVVAPGFDFRDFELGDRASLVAQFPADQTLVESLTRAEPVSTLPRFSKTAVIIVAMDSEAEELATRLELEPKAIAPLSQLRAPCFHRHTANLDLYLITNPGSREHANNIGTIAAAQAATLALAFLQPDMVISAGVAGAYADTKLTVGDVVYGTEAMLHGHQIPLAALKTFGQSLYSCAKYPVFIEQSGVKLGAVSSGNQFLTATDRNQLPAERRAAVEDMEAAAIAQVLSPTQVDFVCLKAVTNLTGVPPEQEAAESNQFDVNLKKALSELGDQLSALIEYLSHQHDWGAGSKA
jgi:nucleoside phosphorylase